MSAAQCPPAADPGAEFDTTPAATPARWGLGALSTLLHLGRTSTTQAAPGPAACSPAAPGRPTERRPNPAGAEGADDWLMLDWEGNLRPIPADAAPPRLERAASTGSRLERQALTAPEGAALGQAPPADPVAELFRAVGYRQVDRHILHGLSLLRGDLRGLVKYKQACHRRAREDRGGGLKKLQGQSWQADTLRSTLVLRELTRPPGQAELPEVAFTALSMATYLGRLLAVTKLLKLPVIGQDLIIVSQARAVAEALRPPDARSDVWAKLDQLLAERCQALASGHGPSANTVNDTNWMTSGLML